MEGGMTGWPNLVPIPELYRWLRNEVPGGRVLAPVSAWVGWLVLIVLATRFLWVTAVAPVLYVVSSLVGGPAFVIPPPTYWVLFGQLSVGAVVVGVIAGFVYKLDKYVRRLATDLRALEKKLNEKKATYS